jgi:hypothetical protein
MANGIDVVEKEKPLKKMKTPMKKKCLVGIFLASVLIFMWGIAFSGQGGVVQKVKNANTPVNDGEPVAGHLVIEEKTVRVGTPYQGGRFWTQTRKDKMTRFKCSQCHNNETVTAAQSAKTAHGDIVLDHGGEDRPLACMTCHKKNERDFLVTEAGLKVDMDHSYQMCGQCHFRQKKDWVGGAHGKRIANWAGQRVVENCTSCHDPHSPRFAKRWPKTYSPPFKK